MANVYLGKKFSSAEIRDLIANADGQTDQKLVGFAIKADDPAITEPDFEISKVNPKKDITLTPIYIETNFSSGNTLGENADMISFNLGDSLIGIVTGELIQIKRSEFSVGKAEEIEFYEEHSLEREFDMAFLSREDMMLLTDYSEEIIISGAEINNGIPHLKPRETGVYFSFKIEGGLPVNFSDADNPLSIDVYPQMLFASPCPPYWRNPINASELTRLYINNVKGGELDRERLLFLASSVYTKWVDFTIETAGYETKIPDLEVGQKC